MSACEKCWADAYRVALMTGKDHSEVYGALLVEREEGNPCSNAERAGQFACDSCDGEGQRCAIHHRGYLDHDQHHTGWDPDLCSPETCPDCRGTGDRRTA